MHCYSQYSLLRGLKVYKEKAMDAVIKEVTQLHNRGTYVPVYPGSIPTEYQFIVEKSNYMVNLWAN